jgi:hypothetical protein
MYIVLKTQQDTFLKDNDVNCRLNVDGNDI